MSSCDYCKEEFSPGEREACVDDCLFHAACACIVLGKEVARLREENRDLRSILCKTSARASAASLGIFRTAR